MVGLALSLSGSMSSGVWRGGRDVDDAAPGVEGRCDLRGRDCRFPQPRWLETATASARRWRSVCVILKSGSEHQRAAHARCPALLPCPLRRQPAAHSREPTAAAAAATCAVAHCTASRVAGPQRSRSQQRARRRNPRGHIAAGSAAALSRTRLPRCDLPAWLAPSSSSSPLTSPAQPAAPMQSLSCIARGQKTFVRISPCAD